MTKGGI